MSIRTIVDEVIQQGTLTQAQEDEILSLIKSGKFDEDDAAAVDELMEALAAGQVRCSF